MNTLSGNSTSLAELNTQSAQPVWLIDSDELSDALTLGLHPQYEIHSVNSCFEFFESCRVKQAGVVIINEHVHDFIALSFLEKLRIVGSPFRVIVIGSQSSISEVVLMLEKGVASYLALPIDFKRLKASLQMAFAKSKKLEVKLSYARLVKGLSEREREIFSFVCQGLKNSDIAKVLALSQRTVEVHRQHISKKLGDLSALRILYELSKANDDGLFDNEETLTSYPVLGGNMRRPTS